MSPLKDQTPEKRRERQRQKYAENNGRWHREYYEKNKEEIRKKQKEYRIKNRERNAKRERERRQTPEYKEYYEKNRKRIRGKQSEWEKENKKRINKRRGERYKTDIQYKLTRVLRSRFRGALKRYLINSNIKTKNGSAVQDLGCTVAELKIYLENKFKEGMTWENWGSDGWHIDHIKPISSFDLSNPDEIKKAVNYTNLQPLWCHENCKKGDRY